MMINGVFTKVSRCTNCEHWHPKDVSCQRYANILRHRYEEQQKAQKLRKMVSPAYEVVDDEIELIVWRGRTIDLTTIK
jgi:hypothetical protein